MEDPRIISALFIFLKMAYYNVLINSHIWHLLFMPVSGHFSFKILWFGTIVLDN